MKIKTLEAAGYGQAIHAMRNPMDSWEKSDTRVGMVGPKDRELSEKLAAAGPAHSKHLRMIIVWAEIWAPRYWWMEFATHRHGVEMLSCSTMHRLTSRPLNRDDFEWSGPDETIRQIIGQVNEQIEESRMTMTGGAPSDIDLAFRELKQMLPESYIQRRTVMMSYQALRNMYELRAGHRLKEWAQFRAWCETLPESWMITGIKKKESGNGEHQTD